MPQEPLMTPDPANERPPIRSVRVLIVALVGVLVGLGFYAVVSAVTTPRRTTPVYDPPVLAGQVIPGYCSAGVYARRGDTIVLTTSPHCGGEGLVAYDPGRTTVQGVFGPSALDATCPYPGHTCASSDMNYLVVAPDRIPWGHLNVVDMGTGGYRVIEAGTKALGCAGIEIGDTIEVDGRGIYRSGPVEAIGENLHPPAEDGSYFPCMIVARVDVGGGDSGSVVLVHGIPAGVTSRNFNGMLGFTPLAEGLAQLGLELCTTPDCGLVRLDVPMEP
ncbi:MAG TPA: hypothetical protein VM408_00500 [Methylomirabilota bacterium]|nr:hypothetical protein [Methylomirabilota bacterium]